MQCVDIKWLVCARIGVVPCALKDTWAIFKPMKKAQKEGNSERRQNFLGRSHSLSILNQIYLIHSSNIG